jgi:hypothetical protein
MSDVGFWSCPNFDEELAKAEVARGQVLKRKVRVGFNTPVEEMVEILCSWSRAERVPASLRDSLRNRLTELVAPHVPGGILSGDAEYGLKAVPIGLERSLNGKWPGERSAGAVA